MCVDGMNSLRTEVDSDLTNLSHEDPHLQSNTHTAVQVCARAQHYNQQVQSTLSAAG